MTGTLPCPFCMRTDRPMTREHVFANWLIRRVHGSRLVPTRSADAAEPARISRLTVSVCASCNAGWMSGLEVSFRRMLFARPRTGVVPAPDRVMLSRWFAKTAALLAFAHGSELVSADQRAQLANGVPDAIEVFLARRRRPPQRVDYALSVTADSVSVAIQIDDVVAHVAPPDVLTRRHGTRLWPLRSHTLRWDTLPVIAPLEGTPISGRG